jgi:hypothetical protein
MVMDRAATKGDARLLKDDILTCPVCNGDSIAYCFSPDSDLNEEMKEAVAANPTNSYALDYLGDCYYYAQK